MASFSEWLENEKKKVTDFSDPEAKVGDQNKSEEVIGELSEDLRRHWTVMYNHFKELNKKEEAFEMTDDSEASQDEFEELMAMRRRGNILGDLFWEEVHTAFGHHTENMGIREGFKVVTFKEAEYESFPFSGGMIIGIGR